MDLQQYLRVFRANWLAVVLLTIAGVALAYGWTMLQPRVYSADSTAIIQANMGESGASELSMAALANSVTSGKVSTYADLGASRSVAERVIEDLDLEVTPGQLANSITVTSPLDTVSLRISADASTPEGARDLAEAWVRAMVLEVNLLETQDEATQGSTFLTQIDSARPGSLTSPNVRLALAIGGLVGLAAGIAYAILKYTLDRRIRSVEGVEQATGVAVVGTVPVEKTFTAESRLIPFDGGNSASSSKAHLFGIAEAMRELRTNIQFMDVDRPPRVLVVTSPLSGDGKSTTASNLAITLAASGQRTILIDGDLRRPMISTIFGLTNGAGLTDVLAGTVQLADVAQPVGSHRNLVVVGAGKVPPNPSEVLGSERMRELLEALSEQATVIIDAPPLIPVTDAAVIANRADGAVIVATVGKTTFEVLGKALANLQRAGVRPLGIVLNRVPRKGSGAAYYGYQYQGEYYRSPSAPDITAPGTSDGSHRVPFGESTDSTEQGESLRTART